MDNVLQHEEQTILTGFSPPLSLLQVNYDTTFYPSGTNPVPRPSPGRRSATSVPRWSSMSTVNPASTCGRHRTRPGSPRHVAPDAGRARVARPLHAYARWSRSRTPPCCSPLGSLLVPFAQLTSVINEQISKLPLAATSLPVDVNAVLPNFGNFGFGYLTKGSSAPRRATRRPSGVGSSPLLSLSDTTVQPGPSLTQTISIGGSISIDNTWAPVPAGDDRRPHDRRIGRHLASFVNTVSSPSDWTFNLPPSSTEGITASVNELTQLHAEHAFASGCPAPAMQATTAAAPRCPRRSTAPSPPARTCCLVSPRCRLRSIRATTSAPSCAAT